ncbi:YdaS family helix-turn-helix protein [Gluconobacter cadivus]|uniref:YdaS family helix-turn-helix protein n=1 Tax=Gluconobacter cadivus TaxID=2728101 RepID=UPI0038B38AD7
MSLARRLGVSHTTVSRWISKQTIPSPRMLSAIHTATSGQVTASDLIHGAAGVEQGRAA